MVIIDYLKETRFDSIIQSFNHSVIVLLLRPFHYLKHTRVKGIEFVDVELREVLWISLDAQILGQWLR